MAGKKRGLGRGLEALLPKQSQAPKEQPPENQASRQRHGELDEIPVEFIRPGRYQPRSHFDEDAISDLAASIRAQGVMQPIVLRQTGENRYELIAGERRWRAAQQAGLEKIPAVIREVSDESALAMSLIENIQREDLNPLEEALALKRLIDEFQFTHQEVADAVGRSRSAVTNMLRLTSLTQAVAEMLANGDIEMGHARAILSLPAETQLAAARAVVAKGLNVRQAESLVRNMVKPDKPLKQPPVQDTDTRRLESSLAQSLGQPVQIRHSRTGKGKLVISYSSLDELDGILAKMGYEE